MLWAHLWHMQLSTEKLLLFQANYLVTIQLYDYPSYTYANSKECSGPVVVEYWVGGFWSLLKCTANSIRADTWVNLIHYIFWISMGRRVRDYPSYAHLKECSGCSGRLMKYQHWPNLHCSWANFTSLPLNSLQPSHSWNQHGKDS